MKAAEKYGLGTRRALEASLKEVITQFKAETERQFGLPDPDQCAYPCWQYVEQEGVVPSFVTEQDPPRECKVRRIVFRKETFGIGRWKIRLWVRD